MVHLMFVYVRCKARREALVPKSRENVLLRQKQVLNKVNFLIICVSENCRFTSEYSEDMCLVKNGFSTYIGDDEARELVIICNHFHFSSKNEWTKDCVQSPKRARQWRKNHVTLMQEMNHQCDVSLSDIKRLWIRATQSPNQKIRTERETNDKKFNENKHFWWSFSVFPCTAALAFTALVYWLTNQKRATGMTYFCRLTWKLASPRSPFPTKNQWYFSIGFKIIAGKKSSVVNKEFTCFAEQDNLCRLISLLVSDRCFLCEVFTDAFYVENKTRMSPKLVLTTNLILGYWQKSQSTLKQRNWKMNSANSFPGFRSHSCGTLWHRQEIFPCDCCSSILNLRLLTSQWVR